LRSILKKNFPEIDERIISKYVRTRTFIRIQHLNQKAKVESIKRNARKKYRQWISSSAI